jgi:hypothetical protein
MKRCPHCEFVYEDEQAFCDMDGSKLAFDSGQLPKLQALTNSPGSSPSKGSWRGRLITAAAGLVLATVLGLVYYVSTHRAARPQPLPASRQAIPVRSAEEPPKTEVNPSATQSALPDFDEKKESPDKVADKVSSDAEAKPAPKPEAAAPDTTKKKRPANLNTSQPQPVKPASAEEKPKKESKVSAVLKKTGRILKKPFRF